MINAIFVRVMMNMKVVAYGCENKTGFEPDHDRIIAKAKAEVGVIETDTKSN